MEKNNKKQLEELLKSKCDGKVVVWQETGSDWIIIGVPVSEQYITRTAIWDITDVLDEGWNNIPTDLKIEFRGFKYNSNISSHQFCKEWMDNYFKEFKLNLNL